MSVIAGGPGGATWWDKVPSKFAGWGAEDHAAAGFRSVPGCDRAPLGLYRAGRRADAVLRQSRRLCRRGNHGRHLGRRSAPARRSARTCIFPAASASAACWSRCRPGRPSSRTIASSARAPRSSRASSSARARCCRWASSSAPRPRSSTARPARSMSAMCRPIRWWSPAPCRASPCPTASPGPSLYCAVIVKTRRRADPLQDRHQRTVAGLMDGQRFHFLFQQDKGEIDRAGMDEICGLHSRARRCFDAALALGAPPHRP